MRGLHFQSAPHAEEKIVTCTQGAIFDVIVDLRPDSETFARHFAQELSPDNGLGMYIPKGFAHGFQTLRDESIVSYAISEPYVPGASAGVRWDDPAIGIAWPLAPAVLSERDATLPTVESWLRLVRDRSS